MRFHKRVGKNMDISLQKSQKLQKFHREALYPLFEQVFGITTEMLKDYHIKGQRICIITDL
jgi:hypothetical protein